MFCLDLSKFSEFSYVLGSRHFERLNGLACLRAQCTVRVDFSDFEAIETSLTSDLIDAQCDVLFASGGANLQSVARFYRDDRPTPALVRVVLAVPEIGLQVLPTLKELSLKAEVQSDWSNGFHFENREVGSGLRYSECQIARFVAAPAGIIV